MQAMRQQGGVPVVSLHTHGRSTDPMAPGPVQRRDGTPGKARAVRPPSSPQPRLSLASLLFLHIRPRALARGKPSGTLAESRPQLLTLQGAATRGLHTRGQGWICAIQVGGDPVA